MNKELVKTNARSKTVSPARRIIGDTLIVLLLFFTAYLCIIMLQRINSVVLKNTYRKIFHNELILCGVLLLFALDLRFGFFTWFHAKALRVGGWCLRILVVLFAAGILFFCGRVVFGGMCNTAREAEHVIVLGMALQDGKPTRDLLYRLDTAQRYLEGHPSATLILTGGNPNDAGLTEAGIMQAILSDRGVPTERMVLEDKASSTRENFTNSARMLNPAEPVVLISSNYHMNRAVRMAEEAGFHNCLRLPAPSDPVQYGANMMWEVILELNDLVS